MQGPQVFAIRKPLVLSGMGSNTVISNSQVNTIESLIGDQTNYDGAFYNLGLMPVHFRQPITNPVVLFDLGDDNNQDAIRGIILSGQPVHGVPLPLIDLILGDQTNLDGTVFTAVHGASYRQPVPLRPPVPTILGDVTNQDAIVGIVLVGSPIHAILSMSLPVVEVALGDQTYVDGSVNIAVRGAPYRQPVPHSTVLNTLGDTTNQDAVFGIICNAQPYHQPAVVPPMSILGNQDNSEAIVVFPRSPESYFQATLRTPLVSVGHQDYADGIVDVPRVQQANRQSVPLRSVSISIGDDRGLDGFVSILAVPINPPPPPPPTNYLPVISTIIGDQTYYDGTGLIVAFGATFQKVIKPVGLPTRIWRIIKRQTTR